MRKFSDPGRISSYIRKAKEAGASVGLVPTMGALHEGHLSLARMARAENDLAVMSVFVNPKQFGRGEDFGKYPRDIGLDERLARGAGMDALFYPSAGSMYPEGYATYVEVEGVTERLCGASRPGHFRGVTTVVAKLFNIIAPDKAYFGQKDAQQAIVIKKMVSDLNMGIDVRVMPIVRERDGLAMSSRNRYLSSEERSDALVLHESLRAARSMVKRGVRDCRRIKRAMRDAISEKKSAHIDYISISGLGDLKEKKRIRGAVLIALAVRIGKTRLVDNIILGGRI